MNAYESTMNFTRRAVWAQIDLDAAAHNMRQIRKHVRVPRVYMKNGKAVGREEYLFDTP